MKTNTLTQSLLALVAIAALFAATATTVHAKDTVEEYLREYPNQEQVKMMETWLKKNEKGTFWFTGLVDHTDTTVVTAQATVDYGYNWFSVSDGPAIVRVPEYDRFYSVTVFDMKHNIPAVIVSAKKPILIKRPGQKIPKGDFHVVEMETDQGLLMTRYVVVDNLDHVIKLRKKIVMEGGKGDMIRNVQRFSSETEKNAHAVMETVISYETPDNMFGKVIGDVSFLSLAAGVNIGQLGTPPDSVRYAIMLTDDDGQPLKGNATYRVTDRAVSPRKAAIGP